ncbi:MAG TPA: alpha-amylase family glycosyl hydrolase, partial [Candidatus Binatia bacterium]|nr:alpha-amylase family glycosyl hydrolase [Candidatus Binatia bacterium]
EMFPRSCGADERTHGTLRDCAARLPYLASMGFDVLYLPPIHPIGRTRRKGPDGRAGAGPEDPGSPWAIGAVEGGHAAVHPALGSLADFDFLVREAARHGIEIALDLAFQCSPDHPWVVEHPEWFRRRRDEGAPSEHEDILPIDFDTAERRELWEALRDVVLFWARRGVRIFRADNPHTKPFLFWEWLIREVQSRHADAVFLAEAFTRPKLLRRLSKSGFSQSYTYFTWRNTKQELIDYFTEVQLGEARQYLRPHLFANTPDVLPEYLQHGGRPAFQARLILAATLAGSYGIYGPAFELCERRAIAPGSEHYADSEKYRIRRWNLEDPSSLGDLAARLNRIRRDNPALRHDRSLRFVTVENEHILCFARATPDRSNVLLVAVNLDPHHYQGGWTDLPLGELGLDARRPFQVHDLLSDARYAWQGPRNFIGLDPFLMPAHVLRVRHPTRSENDFEYFF